jgi:hypothetical protein
MMKIAFAIALCIALEGCAPQCTPGATRCVGDSAQVCLANGQWREFESCSAVGQQSGGSWQCGASPSVDGGVTCVGGGFCDATEPTPEMVKAFWSYLDDVYGAKQIDKKDAPSMELVADVLQTVGIQNEQTFLTKYTTTIGTKIYTPFDIGVPTPDYSLWAQMWIGVHEHQHVVQYRNEGIDFMAKYLVSSADRAAYEAEAYRTGAELDWWRYRLMDSSLGLANHLQSYNCTASDIGSAHEIIQLTEDTIRQGGFVSEATVTAVEWLEANAPKLRVSG